MKFLKKDGFWWSALAIATGVALSAPVSDLYRWTAGKIKGVLSR